MTTTSQKIHSEVRAVTERIRDRSAPDRAPITSNAWRRRASAARRARDCPAPILRMALPPRIQGDKEALKQLALAEHRHRVGLQRHAVGASAAGALSRADQARGARGGRGGAIRRRRAGHVRRRHAGTARHGAVAVQPRRDRDGDRGGAVAQHVRLRRCAWACATRSCPGC
jgi:hypothetical protein